MRKTILTLVAVMAVLFASCGGGSNDEPSVVNPIGPEPTPKMTSLEISPQRVTLHLNEMCLVSAKCTPSELYPCWDIRSGRCEQVILEDDSIPNSVSHMWIKGKEVGEDIIVVVSDIYDAALRDTCYVTVTDEPVNAQEITLDKSEIELFENENDTVIATILPTFTTEPITWTSENEEIVTVTWNQWPGNNVGLVCGGRPGTTNIVATSSDGKVVAKCKVTVKSNNQIEYHPYDDDTQW